MEYRRLGKTDLHVSSICLGSWALIGDGTWGPQDRQESLATVQAAVDAGINFFDTAPGYGDGQSEELVGKALAGLRKDVVIATKVSRSDLSPADVARSCDRSLMNLRTDYIDLLQVHWPRPDIPLADTFGAMRRLQEAGKVRAVGVSNFGVSYLEEMEGAARLETNQLCYSLLWRPIEREVLPLCRRREIGVLCYSPLCQGLLTGKFASADEVPEGRARTRLFAPGRPQSRHHDGGCEAEVFRALKRIAGIAEDIKQPMSQVALAWLLAQEGVTAVIAGARRAAQARDNARAADLKLAPDVVAALSEVTEKVKAYAGTNADLWQTDSRMER